jgi:L-fuculose-phosphate aldolase
VGASGPEADGPGADPGARGSQRIADGDDLEAERAEIVRYARRLGPDGLAVGTAGNLSVRVGDHVVVTPSGASYESMRPEDVCVVRLDGTKVSGRGEVSSEWPMHHEVYVTTDARAVVHTHSTEVVALSATLEVLPAVHYAIVALGGPVRVAPYARFGSVDLARAVGTALAGRSAAILENHGALTYGETLERAYERALLLEWLCGVYRRSLSYGVPRILTGVELDAVWEEMRRRRYGE